jgi:hypothetical protein
MKLTHGFSVFEPFFQMQAYNGQKDVSTSSLLENSKQPHFCGSPLGLNQERMVARHMEQSTTYHKLAHSAEQARSRFRHFV